MESVSAAVRVAPSTTEIREFPMPDIPPDCALSITADAEDVRAGRQIKGGIPVAPRS